MPYFRDNRGLGRRGSQAGVALVFALWLIVLLSMIGGSHARNVRLDTRLAANYVNTAKAKLLAEAGVSRAVLEIFVANSAQQWRFDGTVYRLESAEGTLHIMIRNAEGLVDLNAASPQVLAALMRTLGLDTELQDSLVDVILDWRDKDDLRRLHGAEDRDYRFAGLTYGTPDRAFVMLDELRYVLGMEADLFERLRPFLTLYSGKSSINPQYAPPQLLYVLDGGEIDDTGEQVGLDDLLGTEVDPDVTPLDPLVGSATSQVFHITVAAETTSGAAAALEVVVDTTSADGAPYSILSWREITTENDVKEKAE